MGRRCNMEKLICKSLLWKMKLSNDKDYNTTLDKMFLENSNNDLLLELTFTNKFFNSFLFYGIISSINKNL